MSRIEEQITAIEYTRVMYRIRNSTNENEKIQLRSVAKWLSDKLDSYRRGNGKGVQNNQKVNNTRKVVSTLCLVRSTDKEGR